MNVRIISEFISILVFVTDSFFIGLKVLVPVLFILVTINLQNKWKQLPVMIKIANKMLLFSGVLFLCTMIFTAGRAWLSDNEAERDIILSFINGPHWYQFFMPIFNYALLPMLLWFKFLRKGINTAFNIVMLWFITYFLVDYINHRDPSMSGFRNETDVMEYVYKAIVFLMAFMVFYFIESRKSKVTSG